MPSTRQGFITGLLVVLMPPVGLICLWILLRDRRLAIRAAGEATETPAPRVEAMLVARYGPGVTRTRPRERSRWTQMTDYVR